MQEDRLKLRCFPVQLITAMGKELGIPTPYNEYTYHMIKALEEKNEGVFDYRGGNEEPVMFK